ncbi:hypothetical protein RB614_11800 [Phytohabitans sp. ZYX-F-186]|uniref:Uncharacterized protein n=1 Tax=Phytohabitans maris TaxID=3071409 RepID=A0ABU0ZFV7_9ACTN|nr:hypothetical protein [Phytohabitans sp. ZYX-F-186]MDQ7905207.1 hypothetical protein [Phytohabitans sp. ZYX-F-186]
MKNDIIAQILGSLSGWYANELITFIVNSFGDDVFLVSAHLPYTLNSLDESARSGVHRFEGHNGVYELHYSWTWRY